MHGCTVYTTSCLGYIATQMTHTHTHTHTHTR